MKDFDHMIYAMKKYIFLDFAVEKTTDIIFANQFPILLLVLFGILHIYSFKKGNIPERIAGLKMHYWALVLFGLFLPIAMFYLGDSRTFIYFQF